MRKYAHLTLQQRYHFATCLQEGMSLSRAAPLVGADRRTLARERSRCPGTYAAEAAHSHAADRRAGRGPYRLKGPLRGRLEGLLRAGLSPEQAVGRMRLEGFETVSAATARRALYADAAAGGDLHTHSRRGRKAPKKRRKGPQTRGSIPGRVPIGLRPAAVDALERTGDLEVDTIVGSPRKGALVTAVDRVCGHVWIAQTPDGSRRAGPLAQALAAKLRPLRERVHTITSDNGKEFAGHARVAKQLRAGWFFADPYCTNQRARIENANGLIRQYLPKGADLRLVGAKQIRDICNRLNHRPRKKLGFRTPHEVFYGTTTKLVT